MPGLAGRSRPCPSSRRVPARLTLAAPHVSLVVGLVLNRGVGRVVLDRLDALDRGFLAFVVLARGDDLPVSRVQVEMEFARAALSRTNFPLISFPPMLASALARLV